MNIKRTPLYMILRRNILKCTTSKQLEGVKQFVLLYHDNKGQDSGELLAEYVKREAELSPEPPYLTESPESIQHQRNCGAQK